MSEPPAKRRKLNDGTSEDIEYKTDEETQTNNEASYTTDKTEEEAKDPGESTFEIESYEEESTDVEDSKAKEDTGDKGEDAQKEDKGEADKDKEIDEEDILKSGWFFLDSTGARQGPFKTMAMESWWVNCYFTKEVRVKRVFEKSYTAIGTREPFKSLIQKPITHSAVGQAEYGFTPDYFTNTAPTGAAYNPATQGYGNADAYGGYTGYGGYQKPTVYTGGRALVDRDLYELDVKMDDRKYQREMNLAKKAGVNNRKKKKVTKAMLRRFKEDKDARKRRRIQAI